MRKALYIRFFGKKEDTLPVNSDPICGSSHLCSGSLQEAGVEHNIIAWMETHPDGKVDFVWLTV